MRSMQSIQTFQSQPAQGRPSASPSIPSLKYSPAPISPVRNSNPQPSNLGSPNPRLGSPKPRLRSPRLGSPSHHRRRSSLFMHSRHSSAASQDSSKRLSLNLLSPFRHNSAKKREQQQEMEREKSQRQEEIRRQVLGEKQRQLQIEREREAQSQKTSKEKEAAAENARKERLAAQAEKVRLEKEARQKAADLQRERQLTIRRQRQVQEEQERQKKLDAERVSIEGTDASLLSAPSENTSLHRTKSAASSVEFVSRRKARQQLENEQGGRSIDAVTAGDSGHDYDDFLEDYADEGDNSDTGNRHTAPLRLSMPPGSIPSAAAASYQRSSMQVAGDSDITDGLTDDSLSTSLDESEEQVNASALPDELQELMAPGTKPLKPKKRVPQPMKLEVPTLQVPAAKSSVKQSTKSLELPSSSRPHARSRAFSRVEDEKKDSDYSELFEGISYDPVNDDYESLRRKLAHELDKLQYTKIGALADVTSAGGSLQKSVKNALTDCASIDRGLSLFGVQLSAFKDTVEYIEAQGHGLQVETTNKKLLKKQLEEILYSVDVPDEDLQYLARVKIGLSSNSSKIEGILAQLHQSLVKMKGVTVDGEGKSRFSNMKALKEKRAKLQTASDRFIQSFKHDIVRVFKSVSLSLTSKLTGLNIDTFDSNFFRPVFTRKLAELLALNGMMAFVKQVSPNDFSDILISYTQIFADFQVNLAKTLSHEFEANMRQLSFAKFAFNSPASVIIDSSSLKPHPGISTRGRKPGSSKILQELGLATTTVDVSEPATEEKPDATPDYASNMMIRSLLTICMNVIALQQEFCKQFFSLSSSVAGNELHSIIAISHKERISNFIDRDTFLGGPVEPDREVSDGVYETMKSIFSTSISQLVKAVTTVAKQNMLQPPSLLLLLEDTSLKVASSDQEYTYSRFTQLESRISSLWERQIEQQIQCIIGTKIDCRVLEFSKAYPAYFRKVLSNLNSFHLDNPEKLPVHKKLVDYSSYLWKMISDSLRGASSPSDNDMTTHLALLLNYTWISSQIKDQSLIPNTVKTQIDEGKAKELSAFTVVFAQSHKIGHLIRLVDGLEGLIKSHTDPSKTNSYSAKNISKLLASFQGTNLKVSIKKLSTDLYAEIHGKCYGEDENKYSLALGKEIERNLCNDCMNSLAVSYTATFSKLNPILKQYYDGITSPADKIVINYNFNKELFK